MANYPVNQVLGQHAVAMAALGQCLWHRPKDELEAVRFDDEYAVALDLLVAHHG